MAHPRFNVEPIQSPSGVQVEPERPRWGERIVVSCRPEDLSPSPGTDNPLFLIVFERRTEGFDTRRIPMVFEDGVARAHLTVPYLAFELGFAVAGPSYRLPGEITVPIFADDRPAPGTFAWRIAKEPERSEELAVAEAALAPDDPFTQVMLWHARMSQGTTSEEGIREQALALATTPGGLSPWGRRAIAYGLALSGDLEYAARAVEELGRRYPGSPALDQALRDHETFCRRAGIRSDSLEALRERLARKNPSRALARERVAQWSKSTGGPLSVCERISEDWISAEPFNPFPRYHLATALLAQGQEMDRAEHRAREALDLALRGWCWVYLDAPSAVSVMQWQGRIRHLRVRTALAAGAYADALAHCQVGEVESRDFEEQADAFRLEAEQARRRLMPSGASLHSQERPPRAGF